MKQTHFTAIAVVTLGFLTGTVGHAARISEPDTVLYGRIVERVGEREFPLTNGELVWNLRTTGPGGRDVRLTTRLESLADDRYSYRLRIPHEVLAYDLTVKPLAVGLASAGGRIQHLSVTLDGRALTIAPGAVAGFALDQTRRAGVQRVDLHIAGDSTDTDGDGAPDWWEDQHGTDKYDPTDGPPNDTGTTGSGGGTPGGSGAVSVRTFAEWRAAWFPAQAGDLDAFGEADADQDGVSNFIEYAFGLDPTRIEESAGDAMPRAYSAGGRLGVAFYKRSGATDLVYQVEISDDLFHWTDGTEELEELTPSAGADKSTVLASKAGTESVGLRFFRVRVNRQ